jgi:two-component system CheB/CheR fusion protein
VKDKFDNFLPHLGDELSLLIFETDDQGIVQWREGYLGQKALFFDVQPGDTIKQLLADHPRYLTYWQHTISGEKLTYEIEHNSHAYRVHQFPLLNEQKTYLGTSVLITDISDLRELETQMRHQQLHDQLTGLPNRQLFMEQLLHNIQRAKRHQEYVSVLALEVSGIGEINRRYGHKVSDQLLQKLADGIRQSIRSEDTLCRFSNDEFLFALNDYSQSHLLQKTAERLLEISTKEYEIEHNLLSLSANVGIASFPRDARDAGSLVSNAITAMRHARQTGRNRLDYFSEDSARLIQKKWQLEKDISLAINAHGFELHYQPIFDLKTNECIAAEALLRWPSANLPPDQFIPLAEESGLIHKLGFFVIESAIAQLTYWRNLGSTLRYMSVNLSVLQLERDSFFSELEEIVERYPFEPGQIVLEITESVMMQTDPATVKKLERLKSMGFELAIDDFGTGFSSLNYLKHLPVKLLKVDRSFVSGVIDDPNDAVICEAIIQMSVAMDLQLIAEGVETPEQLTWLADRGVSYAQGYFYAKAVPATNFEPYLGLKA